MPFTLTIHAAIRLAVATVVLAVVLRTWLLMGLIEPVTVSGNSMAPTLRGSFLTARCPNCNSAIDVRVESAASTSYVACPRCPETQVSLEDAAPTHGDRFWIDRTVFVWRAPSRWEVAVAHRPDEGDQLCVKRVVGLPGEKIQIRHGDVWVNGRIAVKSLPKQLALRRVLFREDRRQQRWTPASNHGWQWEENRWKSEKKNEEEFNWLRYVHPRNQPITDDHSYNAGLSRKLNLVRDFLLSVDVRFRGEGELALECNDGRQSVLVTISLAAGVIKLKDNGELCWTGRLSAETCQRLRRKSVQLIVSNFDRQLLLACDGKVELCYSLASDTPPAGTARPFAIGVKNLSVSLGELTLYRDDYYCEAAVGTPLTASNGLVELGENEFFLLGDNSPLSIDSRSWGPVPRSLLIGKPLWVR